MPTESLDPRITKVTLLLAGCLACTACNMQSVRIADLGTRTAVAAAAHTVRLEPLPPSERTEKIARIYQGPTSPTWGAAYQRGLADRLAGAAGQPYTDVWERIRAQLSLPLDGDERVADNVDWFQRNHQYLERTAERGKRYLPYIVSQVEARGMPIEIALLPVIESAFQPFAQSPMQAAGIWQFIPATGRNMGLKQNSWYDGRRDIVHSTRAALDYLQKLAGYFDGDWLLALAAYNAGEGTVQRAIERNRKKGRRIDFWSLELPKETEAYVPKLLAMAAIVAQPARYDIALLPIADSPYFELVELDGQIDLALAADMAEISMDEMSQLNPGFNQRVTDPDGPHLLLLPVTNSQRFTNRLASLPRHERVRWLNYEVREGDSLGQIAQRHRTTVAEIRRINNLNGNTIRAGQFLMLPGSTAGTASASTSGTVPSSGQSSPQVHVVRGGDSLWSISQQYGIPVRALVESNRLSPRAVLHPGQRLKIARQPTSNGDANPKPTSFSYTVRSGDSLWVISKRFGVSVAALTKWNALSSGATLRPGQRIQVHAEPISRT